MDKDVPEPDRLIDEALQDLTSGAPRYGLRQRVLARIAEAPQSEAAGHANRVWLHVAPARLAVVGAVAALGLIGTFVAPLVFRGGEAGPIHARPLALVPSRPATVAEQARDTARQTAPAIRVAQLQGASAPSRTRIYATSAQSADETSGADSLAGVTPIADPAPIVNAAIEITPVVIQPVVLPGVSVSPIETARPEKAPGQIIK